MTGAELITKERIEQIQKHGFGAERDDLYAHFELQIAAKAILNTEMDEWPEGWDDHVFRHIMAKPMHEQLAIAGAFIAAEIDRLLRDKIPHGGEDIPAGGWRSGQYVRVRGDVYDHLMSLGMPPAQCEHIGTHSKAEVLILDVINDRDSGARWAIVTSAAVQHAFKLPLSALEEIPQATPAT